MENLLNWPFVRERQTFGSQQHNFIVCAIFTTVSINISSELAKIKPSEPFVMSSDQAPENC